MVVKMSFLEGIPQFVLFIVVHSIFSILLSLFNSLIHIVECLLIYVYVSIEAVQVYD